MEIKENVSLKEYTTFQIGGKAKYFSVAKNNEELRQLFSFAKSRKLPIFILGGGSNLLISDSGFIGLVIKNEIKGAKFTDLSNEEVFLEVGAGEVFDDLINLSVIRNLFGLENLSGIPGTVGGAVVQNAGAYGMETKDCLVSVSGLNCHNGKDFILEKNDCQFGYRESIFKKNKKLVITSILFRLRKRALANINYANLQKIIGESAKEVSKSAEVREAVLRIRSEKLPDWHYLGTAGSFFKNPVVSNSVFDKLKKEFIDLPGFAEANERTKIPLAWVLDKICNLKGYREANVGLYEKQPLILVNYGGASFKEVLNFSEKIKNILKNKTNLDIEMEVEKIK